MIDSDADCRMLARRGLAILPKRRVDVKARLCDPVQRRVLRIRGVMALQARAGTTTTRDQAAAAVDNVERSAR